MTPKSHIKGSTLGNYSRYDRYPDFYLHQYLFYREMRSRFGGLEGYSL